MTRCVATVFDTLQREYARAIELLTQELEQGKTLEEIEAALKAPAPATSSSSSAPSSPTAPPEKASMWAAGETSDSTKASINQTIDHFSLSKSSCAKCSM